LGMRQPLDGNQVEADLFIFDWFNIVILKTKKGRFFDVLERLLYRLSLAVAPLKGKVRHRVSALFFLLQNYRIRTVLHGRSISHPDFEIVFSRVVLETLNCGVGRGVGVIVSPLGQRGCGGLPFAEEG